MHEDMEIRHSKDGEEKRIVGLLNILFPKWPVVDVESALEHWFWKFRDNPVKTRNFLVASSGDTIMGVFGFYNSRLKIQAKNILCNTGVDVGVHPDYRGRGIYSALRNRANRIRREEGFDFSFGIESNPILIKAHEKRGDQGKFPFNVRQDFKIIDIDLHYKNSISKNIWIKKIGFKLLKTMTAFRNMFNGDVNFSGIKLIEVDSFDSRINGFFDKIYKEHDFIFTKTVDVLNWRYFDTRGGKYTVKIAEKDDEIIGLLVLSSKSEQEYPAGYIVELLTCSEYSYIQDLLIKDAINHFVEKKINNIKILTVSDTSIEKTLKKHMFHKGPPLYLTYTLDNKVEKLLKWEPLIYNRIHFSYGDFDYI